ncbi:type II secretion system protein J [Cryobacterium sp. TMT2-10]|uniref:PulJ/GspJ family protein n=1 Tax=Cryobacterium sp. TMT2-10 TaxID=1259244 RepID=UPI001A7E141C|nr:prepilin-type N-terminal cleavage/methylation domain-containing protein [Cryobacterium sp. TMT2-10]
MGRKLVVGESGLTLVELLVAMVLSVVILSIAGGLLLNAVRAQNAVQSATAATNLGQLIARSVEAGVRNASAVTVINDPLTGTQLLIARTAGRGSTNSWSCQAWFYTPANGGAVYTSRTTPPAAIMAPSGIPIAPWTLIGDRLSSVDAATSTNVFSAPSGRVDLKFVVTNGKRAPILVQSTVYLRKAPTVSSPCF